MSRHSDFNFDLYRLTIHDTESLQPLMGELVHTDDQIISVLKAGCNAQLDFRQETKATTYVWGLRDFTELPSEDFPHVRAVALTLAKATIEKDGVIFHTRNGSTRNIRRPACARPSRVVDFPHDQASATSVGLVYVKGTWLTKFGIYAGILGLINSVTFPLLVYRLNRLQAVFNFEFKKAMEAEKQKK